MKKAIASILAVASIGAICMTASAGEETSEWVLEGCDSAKVASGTKCQLKNTKNGQCLVRDGQRGQTDWNFMACDKAPKSVMFQKEGGGPIKCGDTVAMQLGGKEGTEWFRKCKDPQMVGINICSEGKGPEKMHYDWQLQCSGDVEQGKALALFNVSRKDSIVFAKRPSKVADTCWDDKRKMGQCTTVRDK